MRTQLFLWADKKIRILPVLYVIKHSAMYTHSYFGVSNTKRISIPVALRGTWFWWLALFLI